jgi:sulfotransferase family protein
VIRPGFFLLGASKAGTTSLHYYLAQHPDILMSDPKEPAFFRLEYARGPDWYWATYFRRYRGQRAAGDGAPQHLHLPFVAARIRDTAPDARLLVLCRHPVDRAVSAWRHNVRLGLEPRSFGDAVARNLRRLEQGETFEGEAGARRYQQIGDREGNAGLQRAFGFYVEPGYYAEHIERYHRLFGAERLLVLFFDDLVTDPAGTTARVVAFLGLPDHPLRDTRPQNEATSPAAARLNSLVAKVPGVGLLSPELRTRVRALVARAGKRGAPPAPVDAAALRGLAEHYRPHIRRLAELTGRDLSGWSATEPVSPG